MRGLRWGQELMVSVRDRKFPDLGHILSAGYANDMECMCRVLPDKHSVFMHLSLHLTTYLYTYL